MKVCVIGASFAKAAYLPALRHVEDVNVEAIASANLASARQAADAFAIPAAYDDWQKMLDRHRPELVLIATPTDMHLPMVLGALDCGAHVLCEKPAAMDASEAKAMLDRAEALGRVHMIDHELRFNPNRRRARELIRGGTLGEIRHVNIVNISSAAANPAGRAKDDWWLLAERGGGRLGANGSHQVDLLRWWFGEVASVTGKMATMIPKRRDKKTDEPWVATSDDVTCFDLEMQSGALASVFISGVARTNIGNTTQVFGSEGTLTVADGDEQLKVQIGDGPFEEQTIVDPNASLDGIGKGIWNVSVVALLREMTTAIREKRKPDGATFEDGWKTQRVLDAVKRSSSEGRTIRLDV